MFSNYFKIAWRNITRHKVYTAINMAGLALGICACIVIFLITSFELSYDNFHPDKERIYHLGFKDPISSGIFSRIPPPMPAALKQEITGLDAVAGFYPYDASITIRSSDNRLYAYTSEIAGSEQSSVIIADPHYYDIFKFEWIAGGPTTSLQQPLKVVLSESKARKYFGPLSYDRIMGKEIVYNDSLRVTVAGIVKDWGKNTDFPYTEFISYSSINNSSFLKSTYRTNVWGGARGNPPIWTMVKLSKNATAARISEQLDAFVERHIPSNPYGKLKVLLQPLSDVHFNADYSHDDIRKAHLPTMYVLMISALFILLLAIVNFINLSTAQSIQRIKEIGVRKVLGSSRSNLLLQFLTETFIVTFFAVIIAVLMVEPALFFFHDFIPVGVTFHLFNTGTLLFILLLTLTTSLFAGLYPGRVLSSYSPALSLKGDGGQRGNEKWLLRRGLIVFQFTISLLFIIGTLVIGRQIRYMLNTDFGFRTDAVLALRTNWSESVSKLKVFEEKIKQVPGVERVVLQGVPPSGWGGLQRDVTFQGKKQITVEALIDLGNEEFIPFYQMRLVAGRNLLRSDSMQELIINETYLKVLGFTKPEEVLGHFLLFGVKALPIVGVVADFHERSFHEPIKPLVIANDPEEERGLGIQLATKGKQVVNVKTELEALGEIFKEIYPGEEFDYRFIDDAIAGYYETEQKTSKLMQAAMLISIFISCLGLFGLAMFTAQKRTKEIGIRKVVGASVADIVTLLTKDFVLLVFLALLISSPIAWYFMHKWLQDFAYHITISWWIFVLAGTGAIVIALLTVSAQAIKAAIANPINSLRAE